MAVWTSMMPSASIAAFAESLVEGRRVLLLGSSGHNLWEKLLDRGARLVHVCDPDPVRLAESVARSTPINASFAPFSNQAAHALRDGVFDIGIIDNLAAFPDSTDVLRTLRRSLSPRGIAFVTAPNPDVRESLLPDATPARHTLDYYSLYDVVRDHFPIVRMLGQIPFVGYTVAELAPQEDPEPTIDAGFVPGGTEEPEWFVAAASAHPFEINPFTVVQVPVSEVLHHSSERQLREQLRVSRSAERSAVERLARLEAQWLDPAFRAAEAKEKEEANRQIVELRGDLNSREDRIIALEAQVVSAEARLVDAQQQLENVREALANTARAEEERTAAAQQLAELRETVARTERAEEERTAVAQQLTKLREALAHTEHVEAERTALAQRVEDTTARLQDAEETANEAAADIARFETLLRDRGLRIRQLEHELKSAERVGQQLLRDLEAARKGHHRQFAGDAWVVPDVPMRPEPLAPDTSQHLGTTSAWTPAQVESSAELSPAPLESENTETAENRARLQADLVAAKWRVEQLLFALEKSQADKEREKLLKSELRDAEARLNEHAALLNQLESAGIRS